VEYDGEGSFLRPAGMALKNMIYLENGKSFSHRLPLCEFANSARAVEKGKREWGRSTLADMKT